MRTKDSSSTPAAKSQVLIQLVRACGPTMCFWLMMAFILSANTRAAGFDALMVAVFAWGYGFLSANAKLTQSEEPPTKQDYD